MIWRNGEHISEALEKTFNGILSNRMLDFPMLNPAISVQAVGFRRQNEDWLGVLITPWFMNLLLLPGQSSEWQKSIPGTKFEQVFPYGHFEFTIAWEEQLGVYALCSLFSPMFEFANQADARAAAQAALQGLLAVQAPRTLSRRNLLRGAVSKGSH